jgi:hypothetical protein
MSFRGRGRVGPAALASWLTYHLELMMHRAQPRSADARDPPSASARTRWSSVREEIPSLP